MCEFVIRFRGRDFIVKSFWGNIVKYKLYLYYLVVGVVLGGSNFFY